MSENLTDIVKLARMCVKLEKRIADLERRLSDHAAAPPKLTRQDVIRRAKADVEHLPAQVHYDVPIAGEPYMVATFVPDEDMVRYIVNRDKRTVVALLVLDKIVWGRGKAKCAPDDDFDVNIGKAIALRRALGLPVPDEYLNAPQEVSAECTSH